MIKNYLKFAVIVLFLIVQFSCKQKEGTEQEQGTEQEPIVPTIKTGGYEVWIGTSCTPKNAALKPETWSKTAILVTGLNINTADIKPTIGTPSENEEPCSGTDWKKIFKVYGTAAQNGMVPLPRSAVKSETYPARKTIGESLQVKITQGYNLGYGIGSIMIYDNAMTVNGDRVLFNWTSDEIYEIRNWLDSNGHTDISIMYDARNNSKAVKDKCSHPAIGDILLEAEPSKWYENAGSRQELLKWLTSDSKTKDKRYVFQIPLSGFNEPFGNPSGFQQLRRWMIWLGTELMDMKFMCSNKVVILPVTYNDPTFTFYPETDDDGHYANTLTGLVLSLIEQKSLFEGLDTHLPTQADADSYVRTIPQ